MSSKTLLGVFSASILAASILAAPAAQAGSDALPVTSGILEQLLPGQSVAVPAFGQDETAFPIVLPLIDEIDQNQPSGPVYMAAFSQTDIAQSFMQTADNISGAGILLQPGVGTTDNVTIQLWDGLPNASGTMITEATAVG